MTSQLQTVSKRRLKRIRDQLEFYFSSANLRRDKFLQQHMSPSETSCGYVALSVVSQFPVMKQLSGGSVELIGRGAELSSHLDLSEDRMRVRRRLPVEQLTEEEITLRTIYVERIPSHLCSHGMLRSFFSKYGSVAYVSLPNHKVMSKRKDGRVTFSSKVFAFIEFSCHESAVAAVEAFSGGTPVDSILTTQPSIVQLSIASQNVPVNFGKDLTNKPTAAQNNRKRRFESDCEITPVDNVKRKKEDTSFSTNPSSFQAMETIDSSKQEVSSQSMHIVKKKKVKNRRKPKKKRRKMKISNLTPSSSTSNATVQQTMRVVSKSDWLKEKSEFKTVQKRFMGNLKLLNRQASSGVVTVPQLSVDSDKSGEKERNKRGCDKILGKSMRIADEVFKWK